MQLWTMRAKRSIDRTFSGLTKLFFPSGVMGKADAHYKSVVNLNACENRQA